MNAGGEKDERRLLELLDAVQQRSDISQRRLASHMGVALGLANSYLRRCVRKGYIKIKEAPANRYFYYLTPKGFSEKSRLTTRYLSYSFQFYREAGRSCAAVFAECEKRAWRHVVLCGVSDLAEIALVRAQETEVTIVGVVDRVHGKAKFLGRRILQKATEAGHFDVCVLTDLQSPLESYKRLVSEVGRERILIPDILRL